MLDVSFRKKLQQFTLNASFKVEEGVLGILGASGSGKSLTLQCLAGLQKPDQGLIHLHGRTLCDTTTHIHLKPRHRKIGYVFQNYALFPHLTVAQNVSYGLTHPDKKTRVKRVANMIAKVQLADYADHYPAQLSGGQQQRVALARTLVTEPDLLLLDEPFSALDSHVKHVLQQELVALIKENYQGIVLLVTHDIEEAYRLCDHILILDEGKLLQFGPKKEILERPANLAVARLTGCKNIFAIDRMEEDGQHIHIYSKGLSVLIDKDQYPKRAPSYLGVHAHDLTVMFDHGEPDTYPCQLLDTSEGIFSLTLHVKCLGHTIQIDMPKHKAETILGKQHMPLALTIPKERVFYLYGDE